MKRVLISICCITSIVACNNKNKLPTGILNQERMQAVLWDMMQAQVYTNNFTKKDSSKNIVLENLKLQKEIFTIDHVSKEDFYNSYDYYKNHPELLKTVLDSMTAKVERDRNPEFMKKVKPIFHKKI